MKSELEIVFGRKKDDRADKMGLTNSKGEVVSPFAQDYFENSKRLGLTVKNPAHAKPTEEEQLGMKVLQAGLIYSDREDRTSQALLALKQALQLNPYLAEAWYKLGSYHMVHRAPEAAIEALEKCVAMSPQFLPAYSDLGASYMVMKNYSKATNILGRALEIDPEHLPALYNKGVCYQNQEDWSEAAASYEKIMAKYWKDARLAGDASLSIPSVNIANVVHALAHCYSMLDASLPTHSSIRGATSASSSSSADFSSTSAAPPKNYYLKKSVQLLDEYLTVPEHHKDDVAYCMLGCAQAELGHYSAAKEAFNSALGINENSLDAHVNMGMILFAEGRFEKSLAHFSHALQLDDSLYQVHINLAHAYRMKGSYEDAIQHYRKAMQINSAASSEAYLHLGILLFSLQQFEAAKPFLDEALKRYPESIEVHYHLALFYKQVAQMANPARSHFDVAYRLTLASMPSSQRMCFQLLDSGNYTAFAKAMYRELTDEGNTRIYASQQQPNAVNTHSSTSAKTISDVINQGSQIQQTSINAASLLMEIGKVSDAMRVYQAIISASPKYLPAHFNLAKSYESLGNFAKSSEHLMLVVECEPRLLEAQLQLGTVLSGMGEFERALTHLQAAVDLNRNSSAAWHALADCQVELGHYRTAQQSYNQVTRLNPTESDAYVGIGVSFFHLKRFKDAEAAYRQAIEISDGNNPLAYYNLSSTLFALQRAEEGMEALQKCIDLDPTFPHAHFDLATTMVDVATASHNASGKGRISIDSLPNIATITHHLNTALSLDPSLMERVPQNMKHLVSK